MPSGSPRRVELSGRRYGSLVVLAAIGAGERDQKWSCVCDCGRTRIVRSGELSSGKAIRCRACGIASMARTKTKHGMSKTATFRIWMVMIERCRGTASFRTKIDYFFRGIRVCARWNIFENFLADMGECPPGMSLERIDNDAGYGPDNCKWIPLADQSRNRRTKRESAAHRLAVLRAHPELHEMAMRHARFRPLVLALRRARDEMERQIAECFRCKATVEERAE